MATSFPSSVDTAATLYDTVNNAESTLSAGYTAGGTTLDLTSASLFPSTGGIIYVGNERTSYTGKTSNQLTGVTALLNNYSAGTAVAMYVDADHHNVLRAAIIATQARVGETGSTTAGTLTKRIADLESSSASVATQIHAASAKTTPEDTDEFGITDNAGSWALKKTTWAEIKARLISAAMTWTAAQTFRAAAAIRSEAAATQDAVVIAGRAGGTSSYAATITPPALSANITLTLPAATGTFATLAGTEALTNKSLNGMTVTASTGTFTLSNGKTLAVSNSLTLAGTDSATLTFQGTDTYVGRATTDTLTNKRVTSRVGSTTSSATPTINTDNVDIYKLTAQAADITSFTTNLSGTPTDGQVLIIQITGTAARAITWGTSFEASTVALPTTTVSTNMLTVGLLYNAVTSKWRCMAVV